MVLNRIELHLRDASGLSHALSIPIADGATSARGERAGAMLTARIERAGEETIVRGTVANRGEGPLRLDSVAMRIATGLHSDPPARFFKHGYQSWSASGPAEVGVLSPHPRDGAPALIRRMHQSEARRPAETPEGSTSELFTVIESDGQSELMLAGFIGTASQLTVVSVATPAEIVARALFDGVTLAPGAEREIEPLLLISASDSAARLAWRWAARTGRAMGARVGAPYQRGWCSWYHYFHAITEDALRANLSALAAMRAEFPLAVVQLDDGFQSALGDWDTTNAKFPSGLERIGQEIRAAGFEAGIWTAPFLAAHDSRLMSEHPDWFIRDAQGRPLRAGHNANWTSDQDAYAYALDASNPAFRAHLTRLFEKLVSFGYSYLKLDFLYAAASEGARHDPCTTRAETLRQGLEAIRAGAGERAFILGCGCPLGPAIGIVDGMRIGPDVAPTWGTGGKQFGEPSLAGAIDATIARSFMHRALWLNDPDCLMLRERDTELNAAERGALAATIAASGGMLLLSDDMSLLGPEQQALFQAVAEIGAQVDRDSAREPAIADDLMVTGALRTIRKQLPNGALLMLLNRGDRPERLSLAALGVDPDRSRIVALDGSGDGACADPLELPAHSAVLIRQK